MTDHFENDEVYYKIFNNRHTKSEIVSIAAEDAEKNDKIEKIKKVYPFSVFATDSMIELLSQSNRLN